MIPQGIFSPSHNSRLTGKGPRTDQRKPFFLSAQIVTTLGQGPCQHLLMCRKATRKEKNRAGRKAKSLGKYWVLGRLLKRQRNIKRISSFLPCCSKTTDVPLLTRVVCCCF